MYKLYLAHFRDEMLNENSLQTTSARGANLSGADSLDIYESFIKKLLCFVVCGQRRLLPTEILARTLPTAKAPLSRLLSPDRAP